MYLLDTNIVSEPLKPVPDKQVLEQLQNHGSDCAISSVTWHELWFGCLRLPNSKRKETIRAYLEKVVKPAFTVLPYTAEAALKHAQERQRLEKIGKTLSFSDGQIASIAQTNDLILVTRNTKDFQDILDLRLTNWHAGPS
jgi:tRNA(fMet)-specific endonuclease VapC